MLGPHCVFIDFNLINKGVESRNLEHNFGFSYLYMNKKCMFIPWDTDRLQPYILFPRVHLLPFPCGSGHIDRTTTKHF